MSALIKVSSVFHTPGGKIFSLWFLTCFSSFLQELRGVKEHNQLVPFVDTPIRVCIYVFLIHSASPPMLFISTDCLH